jgi:hypothetical protein
MEAGIDATVNPIMSDEYFVLWKKWAYKTGAISDPVVCTILTIEIAPGVKCRASNKK